MNLEDRVAVTRAIINMLDSWGVSAADQVALLALVLSAQRLHGLDLDE